MGRMLNDSQFSIHDRAPARVRRLFEEADIDAAFEEALGGDDDPLEVEEDVSIGSPKLAHIPIDGQSRLVRRKQSQAPGGIRRRGSRKPSVTGTIAHHRQLQRAAETIQNAERTRQRLSQIATSTELWDASDGHVADADDAPQKLAEPAAALPGWKPVWKPPAWVSRKRSSDNLKV